jgi:hypothetical protein
MFTDPIGLSLQRISRRLSGYSNHAGCFPGEIGNAESGARLRNLEIFSIPGPPHVSEAGRYRFCAALCVQNFGLCGAGWVWGSDTIGSFGKRKDTRIGAAKLFELWNSVDDRKWLPTPPRLNKTVRRAETPWREFKRQHLR